MLLSCLSWPKGKKHILLTYAKVPGQQAMLDCLADRDGEYKCKSGFNYLWSQGLCKMDRAATRQGAGS